MTQNQSDYLSIPNWDDLQHYKDRSPPWIKLHNELLESYEFECLPDASKAHLLCIWLLASRTSNKINPDPKWIGRKIGANSKVDIGVLISSGFLQLNQALPSMEHDASKMLQGMEQSAITEGEESREETEESFINDLFESFWLAGMSKKGKNQATKKFSAIIKKQDNPEEFTDMLISDVQQRLASNQMGFAELHPTTYLNNERWKDEIKEATHDAYKQPNQQRLSTVEQSLRETAAYGEEVRRRREERQQGRDNGQPLGFINN